MELIITTSIAAAGLVVLWVYTAIQIKKSNKLIAKLEQERAERLASLKQKC